MQIELDRVGDIDRITFTSGKVMEPVAGTVGIDANLVAYGGFDETYHSPDRHDDAYTRRNLSAADCVELADYMIGLWQQFREKHAADRIAAALPSVDDLARASSRLQGEGQG